MSHIHQILVPIVYSLRKRRVLSLKYNVDSTLGYIYIPFGKTDDNDKVEEDIPIILKLKGV